MTILTKLARFALNVLMGIGNMVAGVFIVITVIGIVMAMLWLTGKSAQTIGMFDDVPAFFAGQIAVTLGALAGFLVYGLLCLVRWIRKCWTTA
jgi:ABC-type phosphate transport system permease subunit